MFLVLNCYCGQPFRVKDEDAGKQGRCPHCQNVVTVPTVRYWVLVGGRPAGPLGASQVGQQLRAGAVGLDTPVCPVGGSAWLPLRQVPGVAPPGPPAAPTAPLRYWVLVGGRPAGPVDASQAGAVGLDTLVCPVGGSTWLPLRQVPGIAAPAAPSPVVGAAPPRPGGGALTVASTVPLPAPAQRQEVPGGKDKAAAESGPLTSTPGKPATEEDAGEDGAGYVPHFRSRGDLKKDIADIRNVAWWVVALLTAPVLPTVITGLTSRPRAGMDEAAKLLDIFLRTFPLCLGAAIDSAILFYAVEHKLMPKEKDKEGQMRFWGFLIVVLGLSAVIGNALGLSAPVTIPDPTDKRAGGHLFARALWFGGRLLWNYFVLYGPQMFFSSLVVGAFMGWAGALKLWPHLETFMEAQASPPVDQPGAEHPPEQKAAAQPLAPTQGEDPQHGR